MRLSHRYVFFVCLFVLFIYFWLCWVFASVPGLSLVAASGGHSSSRCAGLSLSRPLLLPSTGSRSAGSAIVAHGPSCSAACGILPDQGSNPCLLYWQADSQPLRHQGSPKVFKHNQICSLGRSFWQPHGVWIERPKTTVRKMNLETIAVAHWEKQDTFPFFRSLFPLACC